MNESQSYTAIKKIYDETRSPVSKDCTGNDSATKAWLLMNVRDTEYIDEEGADGMCKTHNGGQRKLDCLKHLKQKVIGVNSLRKISHEVSGKDLLATACNSSMRYPRKGIVYYRNLI